MSPPRCCFFFAPRLFLLLWLGVVALCVAPPAEAQIRYTPVALSTQTVPGSDRAATFYSFYRPAIGADGVVIVQAESTGLDSYGPYGIWAGSNQQTLAVVARQGTPAPGAGGVTFYNFSDPVIGLQDQVAFAGSLDPSVNGGDNGEWFGSAGNLGLLEKEGDAAPGTTSGIVFDRFDGPVIGGTSAAFVGYVRGPGISTANNDGGIWTGKPGAVSLLARQQTAAPGAGGWNYNQFSYLQGNTAGDIAFGATFAKNQTTSSGIVAGTTNSVLTVAMRGGAAPGLKGVSYSDFTEPALAPDSNRLAFSAGLISNSSPSGIFAGTFDALSVIVLQGSQAPGTPTGTLFGSFLLNTITSAPLVADNGQVTFLGSVTGTGVTSANDFGIWTGVAGGLQLVAREGSPAPGTPDGVAFDTIDKPYISPLGGIAFHATLTGTGVNYANADGIWATDSTGHLVLVARAGDSFDGGNGTTGTLAGVALAAGDPTNDGRQSVYNQAGQLVFIAELNDGTTGLFVATVPEPRSTFLLALALCPACLLKRSRRSRKINS